MSMPFVEYTCTSCNFRGADHVIWGQFFYRMPSGETNLERTLGWCDDCATLAPVEVLPSDDGLVKSRREIEDFKQRLDAISQHEASTRPLWMRLFGLKNWSYDRMDLLRKLNDLKEGHEELTKRARLMKNRRSGQRCLVCSSESVREIPRPLMPSEYESADPFEAVPVDMRHPGCTGQLVARNSEFRLNVRLLRRIYDPDGHLIETVDSC